MLLSDRLCIFVVNKTDRSFDFCPNKKEEIWIKLISHQ